MAATVEVSFTDHFWRSVYDLAASETRQVVKAVDQLSKDPNQSTLHLKPVEGDKTGRKYTCRASRDVRILLFRQGNVLLLERAGHHDSMYELAPRLEIVHNRGTGRIVLVDRADSRSVARVSSAVPASTGLDTRGVFDHWANADLREAGFEGNEIDTIRACTTEDDLLEIDMEDESKYLLIDLVELTPEQWRSPGLDADAEVTHQFREAILEYGALAGISPLFTPDDIAKLAAAPIEEWMIFLHPDQRAAAERQYDGPARVRGSAGTGKTVVALHRAAALARRFADEEGAEAGPVLFTTFVRSLPPVFEKLYRRIPTTRDDDRIEFCNVDKLAFRICRESGDEPTINPKAVDHAYASAYHAVVPEDSPLARAGATRQYLRDEITSVIKGRSLSSLDDYLAVERTGRRTRFPEALRRQAWELMEEWGSRMTAANTVDFPDVILRARDHARRRDTPTYRAAIVDEAQDLTLAGLELIRSLVNGPEKRDRPDGLLIVGDGGQRIYPGGFKLRQAGVEVRGRTTVLRSNYRNTTEIIDAAMAVAGKEAVADLGEDYARGDAEAISLRHGVRPALVRCAGLDDEVRFIAEQIEGLTATGTIGLGDFAVSAATNRQVRALQDRLEQAQLPTIELQDYAGQSVENVKVGTHFRIKGLEFKVVFLPRLGEKHFPRQPAPGQPDDEYAEQRSLDVSRLFVAMTRARDGLFLLGSGELSTVLSDAADRFELIDS